MLTPLLLMNASSASAATTGSLTVTTLGRDGKAVSTSPQAVNVKTDEPYYLISGKAAKLPKGTYDVIVDVWNGRDSTDTLGAKQVTVSGSSKVTIDARQGHPVKAALSPAPPSGYQQRLNADLCLSGSSAQVDAWASPGALYEIPTSLSAVELAYGADWTPGEGHAAVYEADTVHKKGLPSGISTTFHQSALTSLHVTARRGPQTGGADIQMFSDSGDSCQWGVKNVDVQATLPYTFTARMTAGAWTTSETAQDYVFDNFHPYQGGKTYGITVNRAVWGPGGDLPYTWGSGRRLYFGDIGMFSDPVLGTGGGATTSYKLTTSGKTLSTKSQNPVIKSAGWYTLTESATRRPNHKLAPDTLSTKASLSMRFYANPTATDQVRGYLTRFTPVALDSSDRARPGTNTTVDLGLLRGKPRDSDVRQLSDSVKKVQVWTSTDGGKTWHGVTAKNSHGAWTTVVHNPASGFVSFRSTVTDSHGDTATTTVINAYAVS